MRNKDYNDELTGKIIKACFKVHNALGPGFKESAYLNALKIALSRSGLKYETEKQFLVHFQEQEIDKFRVDLLVEDKIVVEIKAVTGKMPKVFESQVISYLKASELKVGLLINFGNQSCEVRRLILG